MLLIKLTRRAGTKDPSLTEKEWSSLLSDMLLLQEKVYDCVSKETCYEVATLYQPLALFTCQYLNFHPFKVVFRFRDPQLQPGEKHWYLFNLRPNIFKSWMFKHTFYSLKQFKNSSLSENLKKKNILTKLLRPSSFVSWHAQLVTRNEITTTVLNTFWFLRLWAPDTEDLGAIEV